MLLVRTAISPGRHRHGLAPVSHHGHRSHRRPSDSHPLGLAQADISAVSAQARHATVHGVSDGTIIQDPKLDHFGNTLTRLIGDVGSVAILFHVFVPATLDSESSMESLLRSQASKITTFSG